MSVNGSKCVIQMAKVEKMAEDPGDVGGKYPVMDMLRRDDGAETPAS